MQNKMMKKYFPVFVLPTLLAFTIGFIVPFIMGVYLSFCKFTTVTDAKFVGLQNYVKIFTEDGTFGHALWYTTAFTVVSVVLINVIGFAVCVASDQEDQRNQYIPYCIFYAKPDRRYRTWICMAAVIKRYSGTFPENAYIFFKIRFLGIRLS